ncbi:hypothetical protein KJ865_14000, partial [Myxococcota bacterium]|nr:hypothetical protein [Myxococcota bacterium]
DDCNGLVDDMGDTTCGLGVCNHTVQNCVGGVSQTCDPMEGATTEVCNNVDDDCDGQIDGMAGQCYPTATLGCTVLGDGTYSCQGACSAGVAICTTGAWGSCTGSVTPQAEVCDGIDNDCDGEIDEGLGSTTCGLGVCNHSVQNCAGGVGQVCDPLEGASAEICDGIDNDCDGIVDDGLAQACYTDTAGCTEVPVGSGNWTCQGICATGTSVCGAGAWSSCTGQVVRGTETCNGLDDDCDGQVDENLDRACYTGAVGTQNVGVCVGGTQTCTTGSWGACSGEKIPSPEVCNGVDDDCNGLIDDMGTITCGLGSCNHTINVCEGGVLQTCNPLQGAGSEVCDGSDNDCDGQVDGLIRECFPMGETGCTWDATNLTYDCLGVCAPGAEICPIDGTGLWDACSGFVVPTDEICDGLDNNCDGQIDEGLTEFCYPPGSGPDTGCEDVTGDGSWLCQGECNVGVRTCSGGSWSTCAGLVVPTSEICDGLDNDCDGNIDEDEDIPGMGQPCGGVGVCAPGTRACINGTVVCEGGGEPQPGLCDGLDNNCNGLVDEPAEIADDEAMGAPCGVTEGACQSGQNECINGEVVCVGGVVPTTEVCNGIDDDCNGQLDEGEICDPNEICYQADCRTKCDPQDEQSCPAGYACINITIDATTSEDLCYPQLAPCSGIYCGEDEVCREDVCVNPCEPSPCQDWEECYVNRYAGQVGHEGEAEYHCYDTSCSAAGRSCPSGKLCVEHDCIDDPCAADPCDFETEYCIRVECEDGGTCTHSCEPIPYCEAGEVWNPELGVCVTDNCPADLCEYGTICDDGECIEDPCAYSTSCNWGDICVMGECLANPCGLLDCPYFTECRIDYLTGGAWCQPDDGVWTPPEYGDTMTSTGGGLFTCRAPSPAGQSTPSGLSLVLFTLLGGVLLGVRRRLGRGLVRRSSTMRYLGIILVLGLFMASGCDYEKYAKRTDGVLTIPDGGVEPDVVSDVDEDADACVPSEETCNGVDDDCNGLVDDYWSLEEGGQGHFSDDIFNCGTCGHICAFVHAEPLCVDGECVMGDCDTNWYDFDGNPATGCEGSCVISSGGQEICDGVDNDCNGVVDDHWSPPSEGGDDHFMDDPMNCGECGRICAFPNGDGGCISGDCVLSGCQAGYADADGAPGNGCECIITGADDSTCDGVDNDCNGETDEDFLGAQCYTGPGCVNNGDGTFTCAGECTTGTSQCSGGQEQCIGQVGPALEICDGLDNDCDGVVDEGYDLNNDVNNCGGCDVRCNLGNALARCELGNCKVSVCQPGFWNNDGLDSTGCEYACVLSNNGVERCDDGIDNDCDGTVDEFNAQNDVNNCGSCGYSCAANAPAHMNVTGCSAGVCQYTCAAGYHDFDSNTANGCEAFCVVSNGGVEACDGTDNNCDGVVDEGFDTSTDSSNCGACGVVCADGAPTNMTATGCAGGVCQYACVSNTYNRDGILSNGCEYSCTVTNGGVEACDGADNDCDGMTDEDAGGLPLTQTCYTGPAGTELVGVCHGGSQTCSTGAW